MSLFKHNKQKEPACNAQVEEKDAVMTVYACKRKVEEIPDILQELFKDAMKEIEFMGEENFRIHFHDKTSIEFDMLTDLNETFKQTMGMATYFSRAPLENEEVKRAAIQQITQFNCIIGIQFKLNDNEQRTNYIVHTIYMLAEAISGFILYPSMALFHFSGKLLISIEGETEYESFYPIACSDILDTDIEPSEADVARKARSIKTLKEKGIPYMENLKLAAYDETTQLFDKESIIKRLVATYACCVQAEVYGSGKYDEPAEMMEEQLELLENQYQVHKYFSYEEENFIKSPEKYTDRYSMFCWRYECCAIFMWALSLIDLQEPNQICQASELGNVIWNNTFDSLMEKATLRSKEEILDLQDLVLRYDWACVDARIHGKQVETLNNDVIYLWHYALNWLLQVDGITDWDEIRPNT